jgi:hypothetical protein
LSGNGIREPGQHVKVQFAAGEIMSRQRLRGMFCAESREADREAPSVSEDSELLGEAITEYTSNVTGWLAVLLRLRLEVPLHWGYLPINGTHSEMSCPTQTGIQ